MKFFVAIVSALAVGVIAAPQREKPPACAMKCQKQIGKDSHCGDRIDCLCKAVDFHPALKKCIDQKCASGDREKARKIADTTCKAAGFPIDWAKLEH